MKYTKNQRKEDVPVHAVDPITDTIQQIVTTGYNLAGCYNKRLIKNMKMLLNQKMK